MTVKKQNEKNKQTTTTINKQNNNENNSNKISADELKTVRDMASMTSDFDFHI